MQTAYKSTFPSYSISNDNNGIDSKTSIWEISSVLQRFCNWLLDKRTIDRDINSISDEAECVTASDQYESASAVDCFTLYTEMQNNIDKLNIIAEYTKNWNGYNADVIDHVVLTTARDIIATLKRQPSLYPTGRSTIQLEYEKNEDYLEFEIFNDKITIYQENNLVPIRDESIYIDEIYLAVERFYAE
jgi:hypothetical protein